MLTSVLLAHQHTFLLRLNYKERILYVHLDILPFDATLKHEFGVYVEGYYKGFDINVKFVTLESAQYL